MNTNMKWRLALMPVAVAALAIIPLQGCGAENPLADVCCSDFTPGADLVNVTWGLEGEGELRYGAFMQSVADFTGAATGMVSDVSGACQAIAIDLGADPGEVTATKPDERANAWCALAVSKIKGVNAQLSVSFQPPSCTVEANVQANCEAKCSANVDCKITPGEIIARCDPGKLSGKCSAQCTGSCEGSANLAVACEGSCSGTCNGQCMGNCSAMGPNGQCRGACDGECNGECRGSCQIKADSMVKCEADCTGGCSVEYTAPKCKAELKPPSAECQGSAECSGSCKASASAKAVCKEPSIEISASSDVPDLIATLKANLPKLLVVAQARGELLVTNAQAVLDASGSLSGAIGGSVKATACLVPAASAITAAVSNVEASLTASVSVMGAVNIK